jgi:hypothetical protein
MAMELKGRISLIIIEIFTKTNKSRKNTNKTAIANDKVVVICKDATKRR